MAMYKVVSDIVIVASSMDDAESQFDINFADESNVKHLFDRLKFVRIKAVNELPGKIKATDKPCNSEYFFADEDCKALTNGDILK